MSAFDTWRVRERRIARIGAVLAVVASAGCAGTVTTAEGEQLALTSAEFRDYVEQIFREQNRIATDLAFAIEDAPSDSAESAELSATEDALLAACAGLNELAAMRRDDQRLGPLRQARAARETPECEAALIDARATLERAAIDGTSPD